MKVFSQTCDKLYNRHKYELVYTNGTKRIFEDWEDVHLAWFQTPYQLVSRIDVLDKKQSKGFK
jgi:hypothetical protein